MDEFKDSVGGYDTAHIPEYWNGGVYQPLSGAMSVLPTSGPRGGQCLQWAGPTNPIIAYAWVGLNLASVVTRFYGFRFKVPSGWGPGYINFLAFFDGMDVQLQFFLYNTGIIAVANGVSITPIATSLTPIPFGCWVYLEFGVTINNSTGSVSVWMGGANAVGATQLINLTGAKTQYSGNAYSNGIEMGGVPLFSSGPGSPAQCGSGSMPPTLQFADVYCGNTSGSYNTGFQGDQAVYFVPPNANSSVAWTPHGLANNWQNAAVHPPDDDVDYNESVLSGDTDLLTKPSLPSTVLSVVDVTLSPYVRTTVGGTNLLRTLVKNGGVQTDNGSDLLVPGSYARLQGFHYLDPATGMPWKPAGVNTALIGYKNNS